MKTNLNLIFGILILLITDRVNPYEYSEKDQWPEMYAGCAGNRQSPIDLSTKQSVSDQVSEIVFVGYDADFNLDTTVLINNGHSVQLTGKTNAGIIPSIMGDLLPGVFEYNSLHFHWGSTDDQGSEHEVNGQQYSMEMHIVHVNNKYPSLDEATQHSDGLAVLGIFFEISNTKSPLTPIVEHLDEVVIYNRDTKLTTSSSLSTLIHGLNTGKFFKYDGSLTTPNCSEAVTWIVFKKPLPILEEELFQFRQLMDSHEDQIVDNYRDPQPIGNRQIIYRHPAME